MKKAIWKGNKSVLIFLIILTVVIAALTITGVTYAVWKEVSSDNQSLKISKDDYNPSEKYIIFRGIDQNGNLTENDADAINYAAVGYTGLVAELIIPKTHIGSDKVEKNVVKICTSDLSNDFEYRFNGNPIITSIKIPETVTEISVSACAEMDLLSKVEILGEAEITIGDLAFANCPSLLTFDCERPINGTSESYLLGSML